MFTYIRLSSPPSHIPRRSRPFVPLEKLLIIMIVIFSGVCQSVAQPLRHWHRYGISHKPPSVSSFPLGIECRCPPLWKTLQPFHRFYRWRHHATVRQKHCRRRRYPNSRPSLEWRDSVPSEAVPRTTLGPIESYWLSKAWLRPFQLESVIRKQDIARISVEARNNEYPPPPLRQAETPAVHYAICPLVTQRLKVT